MSDFEVHAIGTASEIRLSRELAAAIKQITEQYGEGIVPHSVLQSYKRLCEQYQKQLLMEEQG